LAQREEKRGKKMGKKNEGERKLKERNVNDSLSSFFFLPSNQNGGGNNNVSHKATILDGNLFRRRIYRYQ